jgi:hypothetical protein
MFLKLTDLLAWHHMWHETRYPPCVAGRPGVGKARARGNIEALASGALRVRVYAGVDPSTSSTEGGTADV